MKKESKDSNVILMKYISVWGWFIISVIFLATTLIVISVSSAIANTIIFIATTLLTVGMLLRAFRLRLELINDQE